MKDKKIGIKTLIIIVLIGIIVALNSIILNIKNNNITKQEIAKEQLEDTTSDNAYVKMKSHLSEINEQEEKLVSFKTKIAEAITNQGIETNANDTVTYNEVVGSQLKVKFIEQVTRAITVVMRKHNVSFGDMGMYGSDISDEMNKCLDESWRQKYGLEITDVAMGDINLTEESAKMVQTMSMSEKLGTNSAMMSGYAVQGQMEAMKAAASNENGAMAGFMGMNMAQNGMANTVAGVVAGNAVNNAVSTNNEQGIVNGAQPESGTLFNEEPSEDKSAANKFCVNCGAPVNGNFCGQCGTKVN